MPATTRLARHEDLAHLPAIERAAASRFALADLSARRRESTIDPARLEQARLEGLLWVGGADATVGFLLATRYPDVLHIEEMSVLPSHGRRGLGRALLERALDEARARGLRRATLTTFEHLPWNAPFYAQLGFQKTRDVDDCRLREQLVREAAAGLVRRVAMVCLLHAQAVDAEERLVAIARESPCWSKKIT